MITVRPADERGRGWHGWLDSRHSFSFADYYDPEHMGFRNLRVINEDWIAGGAGFPTHPHRDMEILTWVVEGGVTHKDTAGNSGTIKVDGLQRMTAGKGIFHSEHNASPSERLHLLQIWILPHTRRLEPSYAEGRFPVAERRGRLAPLVTADGRDGSVTMSADATLLAGHLDGQPLEHALAAGRGAWLQLVKGEIEVNGTKLGTGDGAAIEEERALRMSGPAGAELLLFDLG